MKSENQNDAGVPQFSKPFGNTLVAVAEINSGATVLDLGMGNGTATFFPALKKVGDTGQVIGIDISAEMARETCGKIKEYKIRNAKVIQTDAKSLIFKDSTFDVVLSGFSYLCSSFKEILRVLKHGGQFGLTTWETLEDMEWMAEFVRKYLPVDSQDVCHQDTEEGLRTLLCEAGFENITILKERRGFAYKNKEQWWEEMLDSGWRGYLEKIGTMGLCNLEQFKEEAFKKLQVYKNDGFHFSIAALIALGTKKGTKKD